VDIKFKRLQGFAPTTSISMREKQVSAEADQTMHPYGCCSWIARYNSSR